MSDLKLIVSWWLLSWILKDKDDFPYSAGDWIHVTESTRIHPDLPSATFLFHLGSCHQGFTWCHTRVDISCILITQPFALASAVVVQLLSCVQLFVTLWTATCQASVTMLIFQLEINPISPPPAVICVL